MVISKKSISARLKRMLISYFKLWALIVFFVVAFMSYHLIIKPVRSAIFVKREEETDKVLQEIKVQTIQLESYKESLKGFELMQENNFDEIMQILPPLHEADALLSVLNESMRSQGFFVTTLQIGKAVS